MRQGVVPDGKARAPRCGQAGYDTPVLMTHPPAAVACAPLQRTRHQDCPRRGGRVPAGPGCCCRRRRGQRGALTGGGGVSDAGPSVFQLSSLDTTNCSLLPTLPCLFISAVLSLPLPQPHRAAVLLGAVSSTSPCSSQPASFSLLSRTSIGVALSLHANDCQALSCDWCSP